MVLAAMSTGTVILVLFIVVLVALVLATRGRRY